ncbi:MAG: zinc metalloprotease HtpX [Atribacterota bacterium]|nr:zinc metalloprotease HtpX [Atribacterota bacterium]
MNLQFKILILIALMFSILYGIIAGVGAYLGAGSINTYLILAIGITFFQYLIGPSLVSAMMKIKWVNETEEPELHKIVEELADKAGIPKPKIGISQMAIPNAFAFGRTLKDSRVCITLGIRNLLNEEELKAVLGHEIAHVKHRDMILITVLSVIPLVLYWIAWRMMWGNMFRRRENGGASALIGLAAFAMYFITNLLVLYGSRIREYYADQGSVQLGNSPHQLASALYKLVYSSAHFKGNKKGVQELREVEGLRAFFLNDVAKADQDIKELKELDKNLSGSIEEKELNELRDKQIEISQSEKIMELFTTHPNMLKRIKALSAL